MTNEAYFRNIPVKKLAELLGTDAYFCEHECPYKGDSECKYKVRTCIDARIEWLKQERELTHD